MTQDGLFPPTEDEVTGSWKRFSELLGEGLRVEGMVRQTLLKTQLDAIKRTIRSHEEAREAEVYQFEVLDTDPRWDTDYAPALELLRDQRFWQMTFQGSAHSMAAVGMLAPFIESLFVEIFAALKTRVEIPADHLRRELRASKRWNPQFFVEDGKEMKGFASGVVQLSEAINLLSFLPRDLVTTIAALSKYRNNMFHNGFEWPRCPHTLRCEIPCKEDVVGKFEQQLREQEWPSHWFEVAEQDGRPWLYYMSPSFCSHCVDLVDSIVEGTGRYLKDRRV